MARSESDRAFARDVSTSASRKSDHVTSRMGVATRKSVFAKKCLFPCTASLPHYTAAIIMLMDAALVDAELGLDARESTSRKQVTGMSSAANACRFRPHRKEEAEGQWQEQQYQQPIHHRRVQARQPGLPVGAVVCKQCCAAQYYARQGGSDLEQHQDFVSLSGPTTAAFKTPDILTLLPRPSSCLTTCSGKTVQYDYRRHVCQGESVPEIGLRPVAEAPAAHLEQLLAAEEILLVLQAEADAVGDAPLLKGAHIHGPHP